MLCSSAGSNEHGEMMALGGRLFQAHHRSHHPLKGPLQVTTGEQAHKTS